MHASKEREQTKGTDRAGLIIAFVLLTLLLIPILSRM